jgi:hypothetical protein
VTLADLAPSAGSRPRNIREPAKAPDLTPTVRREKLSLSSANCHNNTAITAAMLQGVIYPKETNRRRMKFSGGSTRSDKSALGKTMASDDKKIKTNPTPKNEVPSKDKSTSGVDISKAEGGKIADASPSGYSRGEGQKPVSKAYKDNWNAIFAKEKKR